MANTQRLAAILGAAQNKAKLLQCKTDADAMDFLNVRGADVNAEEASMLRTAVGKALNGDVDALSIAECPVFLYAFMHNTLKNQ